MRIINNIRRNRNYTFDLTSNDIQNDIQIRIRAINWSAQMYAELPQLAIIINDKYQQQYKYIIVPIINGNDIVITIDDLPPDKKLNLQVLPLFDSSALYTHNQLCLQDHIHNTWVRDTLVFPTAIDLGVND